jgi:dTDP-4-dehydrorhamnose reductase
LVRELVEQGLDVLAWGHSRPATVCGITARPVDLTDTAGLSEALNEARPDAVIHAAAMAAVADCARDPGAADAVNAGGTRTLAEACDAAGVRLVYVSTDLVFDGEAAPYTECVVPGPLSVYGRTKVAGERAVLPFARHAVVRVSWMYGPSRIGRPNFFDNQVAALRNGEPVALFQDEWRTPLAFTTAARALTAVSSSDVDGILHVGGPERMSRLEIGRRLAAHLGIRDNRIESVGRTATPGEARPRDVSLDSARWRTLFPKLTWPDFEQSLKEMGVDH